ncbi:SAM-dependent methyltransferase, partial [Actinomadura sp.]|uniref:SAM-dependent methyltransferase n=1 Tax=Actinomadura sp. TaxID=1989 RepID=UPI0037C7AADD
MRAVGGSQSGNTPVDQSKPSAARIYDYLLGGKDNYDVDRQAAEAVLAVVPDQRLLARANRAFVIRAVRYLAKSGVRQFLDLGTGLPTSPSVHEAVGEVAAARVVYVDRDPVVKVYNDALLATTPGVTCLEADIREPDAILEQVRQQDLLDFDEPVAVLLAAVLHLVPDAEDPAGLVRRFCAPLVPGSHLVLSQFAAHSDPEAMAQLRAVADGTPVETYFRDREEVLRFFDGFELLPPGLVDVEQWRPDIEPLPTRLKITGGVGRLP